MTHEMDSAFRIADRMVLLDRGKFIAEGTAPGDAQPSTRWCTNSSSAWRKAR